MTAVAERLALGAAATAHQHRGRFTQAQLKGHPACAQVGAIAEPAMAAAAATTELMHTGLQLQRLRPTQGEIGLRLHGSIGQASSCCNFCGGSSHSTTANP